MGALILLTTCVVMLNYLWIPGPVEPRCQDYGLRRCHCPTPGLLDCSYQAFASIPTLNKAIRAELVRLSLVGNYVAQLRDRDVAGMSSLRLLDLRDQRLVSCVRSRLTTPPSFTILGLCVDNEVC